jgi:hypothetical protein
MSQHDDLEPSWLGSVKDQSLQFWAVRAMFGLPQLATGRRRQLTPVDEPIPLPRGRRLVTPEDAEN